MMAVHRINPADAGSDPNDYSRDLGLFLYRQSGARWTLSGQISTAFSSSMNVFNYGLDMQGGIAALGSQPFQVFENVNGTWTRATVDFGTAGTSPGRAVRISGGRILLGGSQGTWHGSLWERDAANVWRRTQVLLGEQRFADDEYEGGPVDIHGNLAVVSSPFTDDGDPDITPVFRLFAPTSGSQWGTVSEIRSPLEDSPYPAEKLGEEVALSQNEIVIGGSVRTGSHLFRRQGSINNWQHAERLQPLNSLMGGGPTWEIRNSGALFLQLNMDPDRDVAVINVFGPDSSNVYQHVAILRASGGQSLGRFDTDGGGRIVAQCGDDACYFELPASLVAPNALHETFGGDDSRWTTSGGTFAIVQGAASRVYRQSDTANAATSTAILASANWTNQSVQAEIRPTAFNGSDRWFGLATRYRDAGNYYYVTLRSSGSVQLKRTRNGAFVTLASAPLAVTANRNYRVRLDSTGTNHRVYIDDVLLLDVDDPGLSSGRVALLAFRTAADFDNVIATPSSLTTVYSQQFESCCRDFPLIESGDGLWRNQLRGTNGVFAQASVQGVARAVVGVAATDQVVEVLARPTTFESTGSSQDRWAGVMARYVDDSNYYYLVLRSSNTLSLRKLTNGAITELGTVNLPVILGRWYRLRLEAIGGRLRAYVNGTQVIETIDHAHARGAAGPITWRTAADFDDFKVYQP
ncbi:MAG TPA: hypothetical protein VM146_05370, partial [Steroidobacteraceae bacterium]|nr:hypothetical protein [Steroidobacteraceae bacterium]